MNDGKAFYEVVDSSVSGSKQELQVKAKMWMANAFKDAKKVIQLDDKDAGEVLGKRKCFDRLSVPTMQVYNQNFNARQQISMPDL